MFDFSQFYNEVAELMPNNCRVMEIGVADGDSALYLAHNLYKLGKVFKMYMVENMDYGGFFQMKTLYENIIQSGLGEYIEVIPKDSLEAVKDFNDQFLDFVFLDSSHLYEPTKKEIVGWFEKIKHNGIFAGHDYFEYRNDVGKAVDELIPASALTVHNTNNGYGLWEVIRTNDLKLNTNV